MGMNKIGKFMTVANKKDRCIIPNDIVIMLRILVSRGQTVQQAQQNKEQSTEILQDATFELHK